MAYPIAVTTFPTLQDGVDYPQVAHINPLGVEIAAIEDGLLNGLQHKLTLTAGLQVGTASTFVGNITASGDVAVTGELTVGGQAIGGRLPSAKVIPNADQGVQISGWTGLSWAAEIHDSTALHDTGVNSSRISLTSSGLWMVGANVIWRLASTGGDVLTRIMLDDSTGIGGVVQPANHGGSTMMMQNVTALYYATDTTHYVTVQVYQNTGSTASVGILNGFMGNSHFWAQKVSG